MSQNMTKEYKQDVYKIYINAKFYKLYSKTINKILDKKKILIRDVIVNTKAYKEILFVGDKMHYVIFKKRFDKIKQMCVKKAESYKLKTGKRAVNEFAVLKNNVQII